MPHFSRVAQGPRKKRTAVIEEACKGGWGGWGGWSDETWVVARGEEVGCGNFVAWRLEVGRGMMRALGRTWVMNDACAA